MVRRLLACDDSRGAARGHTSRAGRWAHRGGDILTTTKKNDIFESAFLWLNARCDDSQSIMEVLGHRPRYARRVLMHLDGEAWWLYTDQIAGALSIKHCAGERK